MGKKGFSGQYRFVDKEFRNFYQDTVENMFKQRNGKTEPSQLFFFAHPTDVHQDVQAMFTGSFSGLKQMELSDIELTNEDFFGFTAFVDIFNQIERQELISFVGRKIGHDLANPMTAIMMNQEFVLTELEELNSSSIYRSNALEQFNTIKQILQNQSGSVTKINEIIDLARNFSVEADDNDTLNMLQFIKMLYLFSRNRISAHTIVLISIPLAMQSVDVDWLRMVKYLLENALEAKMEKFHFVRIELSQADQIMKLTVTDNGKKIAREKEFQLIKPLFSTKTGHAGVGLTMVQKIVQARGGTMKVGQEDHKFEITIKS